MRIDSLTLRNYRCFDEVRIEFNDRLTVIVAPNGGGKTAILDAIAVAFGPFVGKTGKAYGKKFRVQDSRRVYVSLGPNLGSTLSPFREVMLEATGELNDQAVTWKRRKSTEKGDTTTKEASFLTSYAIRIVKRLTDPDEAPETLPIIAYYGTGRLWGPRSVGVSVLLPRNTGYKECLSASSKYESFAGWFKEACLSLLLGRASDRADSQQTNLENSVRNVKDAVQAALKPYGTCSIDYGTIEKDMFIVDTTHATKLGLDQQSDGVQAIVSMVGDIASRTSLLNPQFGAEAAKLTPGIVLIDEVDMHLHPSWQQLVLESLRDAFPKVQFIVTTHSPQVLTTVPAECIRILAQNTEGRWTAEQPREQTKGVDSPHVMATVMNTDPSPPVEEVVWLKDYRALIEDGKSEDPEAQALRSKLIGHFGSDHPEILDCDRLIRFQSFKRQRSRREEG